MATITNPIALAALEKVRLAARKGPQPRPKYNSRTADKFVVRAFEEFFKEIDGIGLHQGRSRNSEIIAGILEALAGNKRGHAMLRVLKARLGNEMSARILSEVPDFKIEACLVPDQSVIRLPPQVRDTIRNGVIAAAAEAEGSSAKEHTMNRWVVNSLVQWINIQRQHYALLSAVVAMDQVLLEQEG